MYSAKMMVGAVETAPTIIANQTFGFTSEVVITLVERLYLSAICW
jgi:hypothetical protein